MTAYLGIDPGLDGALAWIDLRGEPHFFDAPTLAAGKRRDYNIPAMADALREAASSGMPEYAAIELVHSMPKQGVASSFTFGKGLGIWLGLLVALRIPYDLVTPQAWQKVMLAGRGGGKDAGRLRALELFPQAATHLSRVKDHGRADALLIAEWRRRQSS